MGDKLRETLTEIVEREINRSTDFKSNPDARCPVYAFNAKELCGRLSEALFAALASTDGPAPSAAPEPPQRDELSQLWEQYVEHECSCNYPEHECLFHQKLPEVIKGIEATGYEGVLAKFIAASSIRYQEGVEDAPMHREVEAWNALQDRLHTDFVERAATPPPAPSEPSVAEAIALLRNITDGPEVKRAIETLIAASSREALPKKKCMAMNTADPPQDCDWPFCGCDPVAAKVVETLQESGWGPLPFLPREALTMGYADGFQAARHEEDPVNIPASGEMGIAPEATVADVLAAPLPDFYTEVSGDIGGQPSREAAPAPNAEALKILAAMRERCNKDVDKYEDENEHNSHAPTEATPDYIHGYNCGLSEAFRAMVNRISEAEKALRGTFVLAEDEGAPAVDPNIVPSAFQFEQVTEEPAISEHERRLKERAIGGSK